MRRLYCFQEEVGIEASNRRQVGRFEREAGCVRKWKVKATALQGKRGVWEGGERRFGQGGQCAIESLSRNGRVKNYSECRN